MTNIPADTESAEPCYEIRVWDDFHYMNEDEAYTLRGFLTAEEALAKCKAIVCSNLEDCVKQQGTAEAIYQSYVMYGQDPQIIARNGAPDIKFSGWDYAKTWAQDFVQEEGSNRDGV